MSVAVDRANDALALQLIHAFKYGVDEQPLWSHDQRAPQVDQPSLDHPQFVHLEELKTRQLIDARWEASA